MSLKPLFRAAPLACFLVLAACGTGDSTVKAAQTADGEVALPSVAAVAPTPAFRLVVEPAGNEARYRVREQLVGHDLPNDAIGVTQAVTGEIAFGDDGAVIQIGRASCRERV